MTRHRDVGLPGRFRKGPKTRPGGEFGFEKRSVRYQRKKKKKKGHLKPNVYTGETRELAKSSKVRATAKGGRIYFRGNFPMTSERRDEIEQPSGQEILKYAKTMRREYAEMANLKRFKRKRKRRLI